MSPTSVVSHTPTPAAAAPEKRRTRGRGWALFQIAGLASASFLLAGLVLVAAVPLISHAAAIVIGPPSGDWPQFHNGPTHVGYNTTESVLTASDVHLMGVAWTGATGAKVSSSPVTANGVVYVGSEDGKLYAYAVGCASGGGTCTPIWTGATGATIGSTPAVSNGVVYVGSDDTKLYAFAVGCNSGGGTCTPIWTGATGGSIGDSPAVAGNRVYVGSSDDKLYAFAVGCSSGGGACSPVWTGITGGIISSSPAVSSGVVYVGSWDHKLYAYAVGCNSGGGSCLPLWTATTGDAVYSSPAVANGVVYVGSSDHKLYAFDSAGVTGCSGSPKACTPLWTGATVADPSSPAVADGVVYVASENSMLYAFGVGCGSGGGTCSSLWTGTMGGYSDSSPAITDGVVYVGSSDHKLYAFSLPDVTQLVVSGLPSPYAMGSTQSVTVTAKDAGGDVATWYRGAIHFTSSDSSAVLPTDYAFIATDAGTHTLSVTLRTAGTQSVTATDGSVTGNQSGIVVIYAAATYHAIPPARVLDTRPTGGVVVNQGLTGPFVAGTVRGFSVTNAHYVGGGSAVAVPGNATAVTGNLTIVGETASGLIALGPTMTPTGEPTTLNFVKGDVRANNVTVGLGPGGTLSAVFRSPTAGATTQLIFDVTGYFTPDTTGATYHSVTPGRVLDTRPTGGSHTNIGMAGKFLSKTVRTFSVSGVVGLGWLSAQVPAGATAVTGNMTVTNATSDGFVSVGPTIASVPKTSNVNIKAGVNCANGVTVALSGGKLQAVWVGKAGSSTDVIFDITGYFTADLTGLSYHPIVPARYLNSATGKGLSGVFSSNTPRTLSVGGVGQVPSDAAGVSGNLTVVGPTAGGWAQIAPTISGTPTSSTDNANKSQTIANGFDVPLSGVHVALIWVGGASSTANLQLDVTGYWK